MAITPRATTPAWPEWSSRINELFGPWRQRHGLLEWPESWSDLFDESLLKVEEFEDDGSLVIRAEMPGVDPEQDVDITVADQTLRLKVERRQETETEDKEGYRSEFSYGAFSRSLELPTGATEADVEATYRDGILEVRVPIDRKEAESRKVPITRS